jgi:hypothetical protein
MGSGHQHKAFEHIDHLLRQALQRVKDVFASAVH